MLEQPIRILLVGGASEARRLQGLLNRRGSVRFQIDNIPVLEHAVEFISRNAADVLLLNVNTKQSYSKAIADAARAAMTSVPLVVLSESDDESLAMALLQQGAQDFLEKKRLRGPTLARALTYAIERHRLQKTLQCLSLSDDLTGLYNRRGFLLLAEQHLRLIRRSGAALLVCLDLDNLKTINDTYGHLEGNRALVETARILRSCFRQSDILARLGGDEFCVLMTDAHQDTAQQVRHRLQGHVDFANAGSGWIFCLSLSIGIADVPVVWQPPLEELLRRADSLMYEQKRSKRRGATGVEASHPTLA